MSDENPYAPPAGELKGRVEVIGVDELSRRLGVGYGQMAVFTLSGLLILAGMVAFEHFGYVITCGGMFLAGALGYLEVRKTKAQMEEGGPWNKGLIWSAFKKAFILHLLWQGGAVLILIVIEALLG
jgi:hypothetical protein